MLAIHWWRFSGIHCKSRTKSTRSATSIIVDHACSCASTQARWTLRKPVYINDSTDGLSLGPDLTARGEYFIRRSAMRRQPGRTAATSECSRTLSSGLGEGHRRMANAVAFQVWVRITDTGAFAVQTEVGRHRKSARPSVTELGKDTDRSGLRLLAGFRGKGDVPESCFVI